MTNEEIKKAIAEGKTVHIYRDSGKHSVVSFDASDNLIVTSNGFDVVVNGINARGRSQIYIEGETKPKPLRSETLVIKYIVDNDLKFDGYESDYIPQLKDVISINEDTKCIVSNRAFDYERNHLTIYLQEIAS